MPNGNEKTHPIKFEELCKLSHQIISVKKGAYLFQEGMEAKETYIVKKGMLQISKFSSDGKELALRMCSKESIVGELILFTTNPKYLFNAKALEPSEVYAIKAETIEYEVLNNPKLGLEFMKWVNDHLRKQHTKFRDLVLHGKKGALYSTLIRMTNSYGVSKENGILIDIPVTNQELANYSGTSRESINRILSDLRTRGILSINGRKILIHDLEYLRKEINCENCDPIYCSIE